MRCQVADMRNLYESLDEVTVKDTLDGDNMYTCSQCQRKVRAEKRSVRRQVPRPVRSEQGHIISSAPCGVVATGAESY